MLKKFDAIEYLVKKYVDDGDYATIPIILKDKMDFFNSLDPTKTSLATRVYEYLDKCSYNIPIQYKIRIKVVCDNVDEDTKCKMQDAVRNHYGVKVFDNNIDLRANNKKALLLAFLGTIFLLFVYLGKGIDPTNMVAGTTVDVLREILLVTGWVFVWSSVENIFFSRRKIREHKRDNIQMLNAEILTENEIDYFKKLEEERVNKVKENKEIRDTFKEQ